MLDETAMTPYTPLGGISAAGIQRVQYTTELEFDDRCAVLYIVVLYLQ